MLKRLYVENIALIDSAELLFDKGLIALTGETGAGKSVIVTALAIAMGERADRDFVRTGEERAVIEATFDVTPMPPAYKEQFAEYILDNEFSVYRDFSVNGPAKVKINGKTATVSELAALTAPLAEILGQHANQMLMSEENHLLFLDNFAALNDLREEVAGLYRDWQSTANELKRTKARRDDLTKERDLLLFQKEEIEKAKIEVGEEEKLTHEKKILDSSRALMEHASNTQNLLEHEEGSALTYLQDARKQFEKMAAIDTELEEKLKELIDIEYRLGDVRQFVEQYGSSIPDDPARLEEINARLQEIYELKRKYGGSEEQILLTLKNIITRLADRPDIDAYIYDLQKDVERKKSAYAEKATELSRIRKTAADYLKKLVIKELSELAIDNGGFEFEFMYDADDKDGIELGKSKVKGFEHGLETGRFLFSANPGEPLKSLVKTASGGEISRVLLALKAAEKKNNNLSHSLLVFDEVDAGIGGQTANEVANKLKRLAASAQIIVITHLHQIARLADHHFVTEKLPARDARTTISVRKLNQSGIRRELERMVALPENAQ